MGNLYEDYIRGYAKEFLTYNRNTIAAGVAGLGAMLIASSVMQGNRESLDAIVESLSMPFGGLEDPHYVVGNYVQPFVEIATDFAVTSAVFIPLNRKQNKEHYAQEGHTLMKGTFIDYAKQIAVGALSFPATILYMHLKGVYQEIEKYPAVVSALMAYSIALPVRAIIQSVLAKRMGIIRNPSPPGEPIPPADHTDISI